MLSSLADNLGFWPLMALLAVALALAILLLVAPIWLAERRGSPRVAAVAACCFISLVFPPAWLAAWVIACWDPARPKTK